MNRTNTGVMIKWIVTLLALLSSFNISQAQEVQQDYKAAGMPGRSSDDASTSSRVYDSNYEQRLPSPIEKWKPPAIPLRIARTFIVTTNADTGTGSLRGAIDSANASPGLNQINFGISGTITPHSPLPEINGPVIINGSVPPVIELNGSLAGTHANGLVLKGGSSVVRGMVINRFGGIPGNGFGFGIVLDVNGGNVIEGNYIGTNVAGTAVLPNSANGVAIFGASSANRIGGTTPQARNVISGNYSGVAINGVSIGRNVIQGNYIGVNAAGTAVLGNSANGIFVDAPDDTIGGAVPGARNIISGNAFPGIFIGLSATRTVVHGNYIGTDSTGNVDLGNIQNGVYIDRASNTVIGDTVAAGGNVISGNDFPGVYVFGPGASGTRILGNYIGTNASGTAALGNGNGIIIDGTPNNTIGGSSPGARNVVSGNPNPGIFIKNGASGNKVINNYVGTNANGDSALANSAGIVIDNSPGNVIGGLEPDEGNLISGNSSYGIQVRNAGAIGNSILGNLIGTDYSVTANIGNGWHGVIINSSTDTVSSNIIAYNHGSGVYDSSGTQNLITNNSMFSNTRLGIDLAPGGLARNDSLDNDEGPNHLQNFPLLDSTTVVDGQVTIHGRLNSTPNAQFRIEFYQNIDYHPSHFGEGEYPLYPPVTVHTDAGGNSKFDVSVPLAIIDGGNYITATAIDNAGNTSEFSQDLCLSDSDGDGILDSWETQGWGIDVNSDSTIDLDLSAMTAHPNDKDVFVEVDAMIGLAPQDGSLQKVVDAFAISPHNGINLHIIKSDTTIFPAPWLTNWWDSFHAMKNAYFGTEAERASPNARFILEAKKLVFRYCIFAYQHGTEGWSGRAEDHFDKGCDDFMVTLGSWTSGGTDSQRVGTFMHELGHTLGLGHGGGDDINYKPNYISIMNYSWQMPYNWAATWRLNYSEEALPPLIESNLDEFAGLGVPALSSYDSIIAVPYSGPGHEVMYAKLKPHTAVDWDSSGFMDIDPVSADLNTFSDTTYSPGETLTSQDDWSKLVYNFRNSPDFSNTMRSMSPPETDELKFETFQRLNNLPPPKPSGQFVMDGVLDTSAQLIASNAGINLYARYKSGQLYVATNSAQSQGADMFIFISDARNSLRAAPSGKTGQVAAWSAFLWNDSSNNSSGWANAAGSPQINFTDHSVGAVLEGVIDVEFLYKRTPANLFIAVGKYGTNPGGALLAQVPVGNGNGNIDPSELFWFIGAPPPSNTYFIQEGNKLVGSGSVGINGSRQGSAVALSSNGNTAIVGGYWDNNQLGAAWVFTRNNGFWNQQGSKLVGTGADLGALQGSSVALSADGNTALVGGPYDNHNINGSENSGSVWVFTRSDSGWSQQGPKLFDAGARNQRLADPVEQGHSVALSADGNTAIVGGPYDSLGGVGAVWVYTRSGSVWTQQGTKLVGAGAVGYAAQGYSIALSGDGNTAIVGGLLDNNNAGATWVYTRTGGVWSQQGTKLVGSGAVGGAVQGTSVSLSQDGNTAIVGGPGDNDYAGAAWVFTRTDSVWTQQGVKLVGVGAEGVGGSQGYSVSISSDGNLAIVGGFNDNVSVGAVWVFKRSGGVWTQQGDKIVGTGSAGPYPSQGYSVSLCSDGTTAIVGGIGDGNNTGAAWVFTHDTPLPIQLASFTATLVNQSRVRLDWITISEINNYGFEIQKSDTSQQHYQSIPHVLIPGHGTTNEPQHYSWIDSTVSSAVWYYRLKQMDLDGAIHYSDGIRVDMLTGVKEKEIPTVFSLSQNYPNPWNPTTTIRYGLPHNAYVTLTVYNILGQQVTQLVNEQQQAGYHDVVFRGDGLASGLYFYRIQAGQFVDTKKLLLLK